AVPPVVPAVLAIATWTNAYKIILNNTVIGAGTNLTGGTMAAVGIYGSLIRYMSTPEASETFRGSIGEYGMVPYYDEATFSNAISYLITKWGITP
ncbi:MAG TPA: hypothetical protein PLL10_11205, partial [Elusimicrobiales bacterium]|nr:hypothetical protein [Elusimicrobiales bacterium]